MFKHLVAAVFLGAVGFVTYLLIHLGAFKPVAISEELGPSMKLIYKEHSGAYHKIVEIIQEVEGGAIKNGIDCRRSFGEYIDKPAEVEEGRLRSRGGCWVTEIPANMPPDFKSEEYPERNYVKAVFEGSPSIGPWKVYSKVDGYIEDNRKKLSGNVIEVYLIKSPKEMVTTYLFPIQ